MISSGRFNFSLIVVVEPIARMKLYVGTISRGGVKIILRDLGSLLSLEDANMILGDSTTPSNLK